MSTKSRKSRKQATINIISVLIVTGVLSYIPLSFIYPETNNLLVTEVWEYIRFLSFIVVGRLFSEVTYK